MRAPGRTRPALALFREIVQGQRRRRQPAAGLRAPARALFRMLLAQGDDPARRRRHVRGEPDTGPARASPRPRRCSRASFGRQRRGGAPVPPVGQPDRDIERGRVELARLAGAPQHAAAIARIAELRPSLGQWQQDQVATQARLAAFPRYRAVSSGARRSPTSSICSGPARPITR